MTNDYRMQLRQLPRERQPGRDLWPAIAAAIGAPALQHVDPATAPRRLRALLRWTSVAACASLLVGIGASVTRPDLLHALSPRPANSEHMLVLKEADAMRSNFQAQLARFDSASVPADYLAALRELDDSAELIRKALVSQPDAVFLLGQLRYTYTRRLELTQRLAML
ncbi:MAG: hypothetical protein ABIQ97_06135 [Lysobacteraceae bacterium]